jgi:hypothetical protein
MASGKTNASKIGRWRYERRRIVGLTELNYDFSS